MDTILWSSHGITLLMFGGTLVLFFLGRGVRLRPGRELRRKFTSLGDMRGRAFDEIAAVVGPPQSMTAAANGETLRQWQVTGYHFVLLFDHDDRCIANISGVPLIHWDWKSVALGTLVVIAISMALVLLDILTRS